MSIRSCSPLSSHSRFFQFRGHGGEDVADRALVIATAQRLHRQREVMFLPLPGSRVVHLLCEVESMKRFSAWTVIGLSCALGIPQSFVLLSSLVEPSNRSLDRWAVPLTLWGLPLFVVALGLSGGFAKQSIRDPFADFRQLVTSIGRASMTPLTVGAIVFGVVGLGCSSYGLTVGSGQHDVVADQGEYYSITAGSRPRSRRPPSSARPPPYRGYTTEAV